MILKKTCKCGEEASLEVEPTEYDLNYATKCDKCGKLVIWRKNGDKWV